MDRLFSFFQKLPRAVSLAARLVQSRASVEHTLAAHRFLKSIGYRGQARGIEALRAFSASGYTFDDLLMAFAFSAILWLRGARAEAVRRAGGHRAGESTFCRLECLRGEQAARRAFATAVGAGWHFILRGFAARAMRAGVCDGYDSGDGSL